MQIKKQQNQIWNYRLVQNWERSASRLFVVTLLNYLHAEYIMWNVGMDESQTGIKIAARNISNLRYTNGITLMAESEELNRFLMKVKEENEKVGLKLRIQKTKIMPSGPTTSWQIEGEKVEAVTDFLFLCSKVSGW